MSLYERINYICKQNNITGKELGEILGLKKSPLTDWKNNKSKPTIDQIKTICEKFAISSDYLLFGKNGNELSENEKEMLCYYRKLTNRNQIKYIGKIEEEIKEQNKTQKSLDSQVG